MKETFDSTVSIYIIGQDLVSGLENKPIIIESRINTIVKNLED